MDEKQLQLLWEAHAKHGGFASFDEFKSLMGDSHARKVYFDDANAKLGFKDYDEFETILKKKEDGNFQSIGEAGSSIPTVSLGKGLQGSDTPEGNRPASGNPIDDALYADELKNKTKSQSIIGDRHKSDITIPDQESIEYSKKVQEELKAKGYNTDELINEYKDFPKEAFNHPETSKDNLLQIKKDNPIRYNKLLNETKNQYAVKNGSIEQGRNNPDYNAGNDYVGSDAEIHPQDLNGFYNVMQKKQQLIDENLTGETRDKAHQRLENTYAFNFNATNPQLVEEYNNSDLKDKVDANQYAALKQWQVFQPEKYKQAIILLNEKIIPEYSVVVNTTPSEQQKIVTKDSAFAAKNNGKPTDLTINEQIGKETLLRELNNQGLSNAAEQLQSKKFDLVKQNQLAQTPEEKQQISQQFIAANHDLELLNDQQKQDDTRYPLTAQLKFDQQVKEITQDRGMGVGDFMWNKYNPWGSTVDAGENIITNLFGSESDKAKLALKRGGEMQNYENSIYLPESERQNNSPVILQPSKELKTKVNEIIKGRSISSLSPNERNQVNELVKNNQDQIQTITNPEAGKSKNFFSKATLMTTAGFTSDIASFMTQMGIMKGVGLGSKLAEATALFTPAYNQAFNEKIKEGKSVDEANSYGMLHGGVMAMMAKFGSKYEAVQNMVRGGKSALSKEIAGMSEEAWNTIYKENKPFIDRLATSTKNVAKENAKMIGTFGVAAPVASDLADNAFYDQHKTMADIGKDAVTSAKDMLIGSAWLMLLGIGRGSVKYEATPLEKSAIWDMGDNPEIGKAKIDEVVSKGDLTAQDGELRKKAIDNIAKLINKVPHKNDRGFDLTDKQRSDYLYNLVVKDKSNEVAKDLPEKQAAEHDFEGQVAQHKNAILLEQPTDKQLETRKSKLEKDLIPEKDSEGKNIEIPEQELMKTKAELKAVTDTIDERSAKVADENAKRLTEKSENNIIPEQPIVNEETQTVQIPDTKTQGSTTNPEPNQVVEPAETGEDGNTVGISHESLKKIADKLGLQQPERGTFLTPEEQLKRGKALLAAGADPNQVAADFKKDGKVDADSISVARAHWVNLTKAAQKALDEHGKDSPEFKKAQDDMQKWQDDVLKPMGTASGGAFSALQGEEDLDTGSFVSLKNAFKEQFGKEPNPKQEKAIQQLSEKVKGLTSQVEDLKNKLTEALDKIANEGSNGKTKKDRSQKTADKINKIADNIEKFGRAKGAEDAVKSGFSPDVQKMVANAMRKVAEGVRAGKSIPKAILDAVKEFANEKLDAIGLRDAIHDGLKEAGVDEKEFDILTRFADKKDNNFTPEDAKDIWEYAKEEYLDKGSSYIDMINGVGKDLGLSGEQVRRAITAPKEVRKISDEIYKKNQAKLDAINQAKSWLKQADNSKIKNFLKSIPNTFFRIKTFGHGTVGAVTHAGMNLFQPTKWKQYFPFFVKQFKYAFGSTADYNKAMEDLKNDKDFIFWKRNGLAVDPKERYDDYQGDFASKESNNRLVKFFNRAGVAGDRGFNALKVYRLSLAKLYYDRLSNSEKADPETAVEIAKLVNHATGTSEVKTPGWSNTVFFAPKLEVSRWQRLITDPLKAAHAYKRMALGQHVEIADRVAAKRVAKTAGEMMATYMSLLAMNSAILSLTGSKQSINYTDPTKNDFLKFKIGGTTVDVSGGMLATIRFIASLGDAAVDAYTGSKKDLRGDKPQERDYKKIGQQARYKLSPFMSTVVDLATGTDAMGKPLPYSNVAPRVGEEKYGVGEYLLHQQTPIPVAEGFKEVANSMMDRGMTRAQTRDVLKGILVGALSGGTGTKLQDIEDKTGVTDKKSEVHDFLEKKESGIKTYSKADLKPLDKDGKPIDVTDQQYKDFLEKREKFIVEDISDLLAGKRHIEDTGDNPDEKSWKVLTQDQVDKITSDELKGFLMTATTRADDKAIHQVFGGRGQAPKEKESRKIE